ncbi:MAG: hypothetical protein M1816_003185 [Peltula sp. TS41687]|nr:MAG: hypothetical protein M1816_003185 [Peltula sp. TS41687]
MPNNESLFFSRRRQRTLFKEVGSVVLKGSTSTDAADSATVSAANNTNTYKCGHVIPLRTATTTTTTNSNNNQPQPTAAAAAAAQSECRVCAWRAVLVLAKHIRRDSRILMDGLRNRRVPSDEYIERLYDIKDAEAGNMTELFEDWTAKWGEPTEDEEESWLYWEEDERSKRELKEGN